MKLHEIWAKVPVTGRLLLSFLLSKLTLRQSVQNISWNASTAAFIPLMETCDQVRPIRSNIAPDSTWVLTETSDFHCAKLHTCRLHAPWLKFGLYFNDCSQGLSYTMLPANRCSSGFVMNVQKMRTKLTFFSGKFWGVKLLFSVTIITADRTEWNSQTGAHHRLNATFGGSSGIWTHASKETGVLECI